MKKELVSRTSLVILALLLFSQVLALEQPSTGFEGDDVEAIENITEGIPIDPETGKIHWGKLETLKTNAEVKIDIINAWIAENAQWLGLIFGMIPEISWLFFINFYIMLFLIAHLVLNLPKYFSFFPNDYVARTIGLAIFVPLLVFKVIFMAASAFTHILIIVWNVILPWGIAIALIIALLVVIFGVYFLIASPKIAMTLIKTFVKDKVKEAAAKQLRNQKTLDLAAQALRKTSQ